MGVYFEFTQSNWAPGPLSSGRAFVGSRFHLVPEDDSPVLSFPSLGRDFLSLPQQRSSENLTISPNRGQTRCPRSRRPAYIVLPK